MTADLSTVLAGKTDKILCPLCLREFAERDIEENLTEEHVVPSSAGGKITTLTCRICNSESGSEIDSHFARVFRMEAARLTGCEVDARIKIRDGVGSPAHVSFTPSGLHCRLEPTTGYAKKVLLERFVQYARGERELNFHFLMRIPTMPITHSDLMAITIPSDADHRRSEATLGISNHAEVIGIRQCFCG